MARNFDGSDDVLTVTSGGMAAIDGGAVTVAFLLRFNDTNNGSIIYAKTAANALVFQVNADGGTWFYETTDSFRSMGTASTSDDWHLFGITKADGNSTPRAHKYVYGTNTFSHTNASSAFNDSSAAIGSGGSVQFGRYGSANEYANMELALAAVWDRVLTDAEFENLPFSLRQWYASGPVAGWMFDQHAVSVPVMDWTGGGANQSAITGTAVSTVSVPVFSYGHEVLFPRGQTGASDATVEPTVINATVSMPAPAVQTGQSVSPAVVSATVSMPAPSITAVTSVSPAVISAAVSMPAPEVQAGQTASPAVIAAVVSMPAPAPSGSATAAPAVVQATTTIPDPTVQTGQAVSPVVISAVFTLPAPSVSGSAAAAPAVVNVVVSLPAPSLQAGQTVTAVVIPVVVSMPTPTIQAGGSAQIAAEVIPVVVSMPAPTVGAGAGVLPAVISASVTFPTAALSVGVALSVTRINAVVTVPSVTVQAGPVVPPVPDLIIRAARTRVATGPAVARYQQKRVRTVT